MTSAALATMTCNRLSSLISLARALATPNNAFRFRAWRSLSMAVIERQKQIGLRFLRSRYKSTVEHSRGQDKYVPLGKPQWPSSDVGLLQHLRRSFIQLIGTPDFFKTRQQV